MGIGRLIHTSHSGHGSYPSLAVGCTAMCPAAIYFATKIAKVVDCKSKLKFNKSLPDGTMRKILDSTFINKLGWKSKVSLTQGLNYTIDWYNKEYN